MVKKTSLNWDHPPARYELTGNEVHVWRLPVELQPVELDALGLLLAADEWTRAERFRFPEHRRRFIARRGSVRTILGRYLDVPPQSLIFDKNKNGKPFLLANATSTPPTFNVSSSQDLALLAVARDRKLGVDIERIDPKHADRQVVENHFSPVERAALKNLPESQWLDAFFHCWCRKEAFIKAVGKGLSFPLDRFAVTVGSDRPGELIALDPSFGFHLSDWSLHDLPPLSGYATALAVHGPAPLISHFQGRI
ncbi:MAG: 4'-phosphopantetheinyl transferase superfamily protein [Planctomycetes bacterium]|nr:4'-phosphopantetheinyl transferase superfamily protein [Planctomycetota bacterium]